MHALYVCISTCVCVCACVRVCVCVYSPPALFIFQNITLPVMTLTLREERRLRVFENRVLRRVFGSKRDGVTGEWRKLHNEKLRDLYLLTNIVRVVK